MTIEHEK
jgi:adenine-specific DNA methylase